MCFALFYYFLTYNICRCLSQNTEKWETQSTSTLVATKWSISTTSDKRSLGLAPLVLSWIPTWSPSGPFLYFFLLPCIFMIYFRIIYRPQRHTKDRTIIHYTSFTPLTFIHRVTNVVSLLIYHIYRQWGRSSFLIPHSSHHITYVFSLHHAFFYYTICCLYMDLEPRLMMRQWSMWTNTTQLVPPQFMERERGTNTK